jgi:hypothetical protein
LLQRLLGKAIADRYVDFCRLAAGAYALRVPRPVAAHALRELDSILRNILEVPMEAIAPEDPIEQEALKEARRALNKLGFDDTAVQRATSALKPRSSHKDQIQKIVARLGLAPDGDVANRWADLSEILAEGAHARSHHRSLEVDEEFRSRYQLPFDMVIRAVAIALQGQYLPLLRRVEDLAAMCDRSLAVKLFASEIHNALALQGHFFQRLDSGDWLPHLAKHGLLGEPLVGPNGGGSGIMRHHQWPAGNYLLRMAESPDPATRKGVAEAVRKLALSKHPDVQSDGIEILAALPPEESAPLADLAVGWLNEAHYSILFQPSEKLLKNLTESGHRQAAIRVAGALLQLWEEGDQIQSLYFIPYLYAAHLPIITNELTKACGEDALRLLMELLQQAAIISGKNRYGHYSSQPIADDQRARYDIYEGLVSAIRRSAELLIKGEPARMRGIVGSLGAYSSKIFVRLSLHVLAVNPAAAPELADAYLINPELIEASWCRHEYAELALAWFPSLTVEKQTAVLRVVDSIPDKYRATWKVRFEEWKKEPPTSDDERKFEANIFRDVVWAWRGVLPPERRKALEQIASDLGDPDASAERLFPVEENPQAAADFSRRPIAEIIAFLRSWSPNDEPRCHTLTGVAQELRAAVCRDPETFAANAYQLCNLKPIYVRQLLEGLQNAPSNERNFAWGKVLEVIEFTLAQFYKTVDVSSIAEGDDPDWTWACVAASKLLAIGLARGADGIKFEHTALMRSLVFTLIDLAPKQPELEDFEERYQRHPFFASQATLRGMAVELCIFLIFWLSQDGSSSIGAAPREALKNLPDVRIVLQTELLDRSPAGRVPRAIIGGYLTSLFDFGQEWLKAQIDALFPSDDDSLRRAAWLSHLWRDRGPIGNLMPELHQCYSEEIARLATEKYEHEYFNDRLAQYLIVLHISGKLPDDLLDQFWQNTPPHVRQRAMWFLGTQLALPTLPDEMRARGCLYWEHRLAAAKTCTDPDAFRLELGAIGTWDLRDQIDALWLLDQMIAMLEAGFAPTNAFGVVERLASIPSQHIERAS